MFGEGERAALRDRLVRAAEEDPRIVAAAFVGSTAEDAWDRWSDIDLALAIGHGADAEDVLAGWTGDMLENGAVHHVDVLAGPAVYRVFLLANTLQVDISFWPHEAFTAAGPRFRLLFGETGQGVAAGGSPMVPSQSATEELIGLGWLYALHVRAALARDRPWQAEWFANGMRDRCLALACLRHGLPHREGRGLDRLPAEELARAADAHPSSAEPAELRRAFRVLLSMLGDEATAADPALAARLREPLAELGA